MAQDPRPHILRTVQGIEQFASKRLRDGIDGQIPTL